MTQQPEPTKLLTDADAAEEPTIDIGATARAQLDAAASRQGGSPQARSPQAPPPVTPGGVASTDEASDDARIREEERAARQKALGAVPTTDDDVTVPPLQRPQTDKFVASVGLFLLRLVLAAYLGVRGVQVLFNIAETKTWLANSHIPYSGPIAWALGVGLLVITMMLFFGFGVRVAALVTAALAVAELVFVQWGYSSLLVSGQAGFIGDNTVLIAGLGAALFFLGSGGWAIDAAMRFARAKRKQYS